MSSLKLTPVRQGVLDIIRAANTPIAAYHILEKLQQGAKAPQTVYRALDYLIAHGLVHKLESLNAYVACQRSHSHTEHLEETCPHAAAFIICRKCQRVHEIEDLSQLQTVLDAYGQAAGFNDLQTILEIRGLCNQCRSQADR